MHLYVASKSPVRNPALQPQEGIPDRDIAQTGNAGVQYFLILINIVIMVTTTTLVTIISIVRAVSSMYL